MVWYLACLFVGICLASMIWSYKYNQLLLEKNRLENYKDIQDNLSQAFKMIASDAIKEEQEDLRKQHREVLDIKLQPLVQKFQEFSDKIHTLDKNGEVNVATLKECIHKLEKNNNEITTETKKLTEALTFNQNIKGSYGENLLSSILENSGLQEHINYTKQLTTTSKNNNGNPITIRPDFVIKLPNNKCLIIDSKMTLDSFVEFQDKKTKEAKTLFKNELKHRINDLANKNYEQAQGLCQPEFILCYIPLEAAISLIYSDNDFVELIQTAYAKNIIIVGTSSVLTAISLVKQLWAIQIQNENYQEISEVGKNLYDAFATHFEELSEIEKKFNDISSLFKTTINRYRTKNSKDHSILKQVERLKELGVQTGKHIE